MKTSARGLEDIIFNEGEVLHAYQDTLTRADGTKYLDVPTVGCGHTSAAGPPEVHMGMTITHAESRAILARDIASVEDRVMKAFNGKAPPQTVFDGAVSFDFNTGGILRASWPTIWLKGDMAGAEKMFLEWNKPPEIMGRRRREANLIFRGKYYSPPQAGDVIPPPPDIPAPKPQGAPQTAPVSVPVQPPHGVAITAAAAAGAGAGGISGNFWWALGAFVVAMAAVYLISHLRKG